MTTIVRFLGHEFPPMASIVQVAAVLGYRSPTTAGRVAERDRWPLIGPHGARKVNLIALAEKLSVPYEIVSYPKDEGVTDEAE